MRAREKGGGREEEVGRAGTASHRLKVSDDSVMCKGGWGLECWAKAAGLQHQQGRHIK